MKTNIILIALSIFSFFAPIELCAIILMGIIFLDTIVKLISLKKIASVDGRKYRDVFKSKMLRRGYIFKAAGYYILALAIFPLDFYGLTPFTASVIKGLGYTFVIPTTALFTNILLCIFALIEFSSINENWFDISGNNILKSVFSVVKKIRSTVTQVSDTYKDIKN
jgi:hypothetical protein